MPIVSEIQDRLLLAFPRSSNIALYRAVQEGSFLVSHLFKGESFLDNQMGRDLAGHARRVAISYQIEQYCQRGDLPFIAEMKPMPRGPLHWLEITSTGAIAHVCRTDDGVAFPDEAESRQDYRLTMQGDLLSWTVRGADKSLGKIIKDIPKLYAWLTFRVGTNGSVNHLCWGSPAADVNDWLAHIDVLKEIARAGEELPTIDTVPDPKDKLRLKDHIVAELEKTKKPEGGAS